MRSGTAEELWCDQHLAESGGLINRSVGIKKFNLDFKLLPIVRRVKLACKSVLNYWFILTCKRAAISERKILSLVKALVVYFDLSISVTTGEDIEVIV